MRRRFLDESQPYRSKTSSLTSHNLEELRQRFKNRRPALSAFPRTKSIASSTRESQVGDLELEEQETDIISLSPRSFVSAKISKLTHVKPFCSFMSENLFSKASNVRNKQQLKRLALKYYEQPNASFTGLAPSERNIRIAVLNVVCNGYGDVVFGSKIFSYLTNWYPNSVIHLLTTRLRAYEELGLYRPPSRSPEGQRHLMKQLLVKRQYSGENYTEKNLADECRFDLSHLMLDTEVPYDLIIVAPIIHPGDATIGKIKKLFKNSKYLNTYFVSDYNTPKYDKAVTNIDFPTGVGSGTLGMLFDEPPTAQQLQLPAPLKRILPHRYGIASLGVEIPVELNCFVRFVLAFLNQYRDEEVIDLIISPDIVRSIFLSKEDEDYKRVIGKLITLINEKTSYNAVVMIYRDKDIGVVDETPERYRRYRNARDERELEEIELGDASEQGSEEAFETSSQASGYGRSTLHTTADWQQELQLLSTPPDPRRGGGCSSKILFYNQEAASNVRPLQVLRLRGDIFPVPYRDVPSLYYHALPPVLISGDQTLTDLLSCCLLKGGIFLYQIRPWKKTFARKIAEELKFTNITEATENCTELRGSITASAKIPADRELIRFREGNDFRLMAKPLFDSIVSLTADNIADPLSAWATYVDLINGKVVVKEIKNRLRKLVCRID